MQDLKFWAAFLDMMSENRLNALTLWNKHPLYDKGREFSQGHPSTVAACTALASPPPDSSTQKDMAPIMSC